LAKQLVQRLALIPRLALDLFEIGLHRAGG